MNETGPQTLIEAVRYFSDKKVCHDYMIQIKWPDGKIVCPKCGGDNIGFLSTREIYKCRACKKQFSAKVDTIFEASPLGLDKWFVAIWMESNCKNGISSLELHRALGITQKSAWFMGHRIRLAMRTGNFRKMKDVVESDETFVGGKAFDDLTHKLAQVPKPLVVAAEKRYEERKKQRKKKRRKS